GTRRRSESTFRNSNRRGAVERRRRRAAWPACARGQSPLPSLQRPGLREARRSRALSADRSRRREREGEGDQQRSVREVEAGRREVIRFHRHQEFDVPAGLLQLLVQELDRFNYIKILKI